MHFSREVTYRDYESAISSEVALKNILHPKGLSSIKSRRIHSIHIRALEPIFELAIDKHDLQGSSPEHFSQVNPGLMSGNRMNLQVFYGSDTSDKLHAYVRDLPQPFSLP